ncbi:DUF4116 domain-containing protein, partial [Clostridioides difficile]|uniref:DUF4116 domain-containing protein n=2 Tax=Clostridioides TaxID=1870884 RepID=UPI003F8CFEE8
ICLEAVRSNGLALGYVKNQTEEVCLEAVRSNGWALQDVRWDELNLSKEKEELVSIEAVKQTGHALQYVKEQTEAICLEAINQDVKSFFYVKNQTEKICINSLKQTGSIFRYIKDARKYIKKFDIRFLVESGKVRGVVAMKIDGVWRFTLGCQDNITKETFIYKIYNTNGGFDPEEGVNVHRKFYLKFLNQFVNI